MGRCIVTSVEHLWVLGAIQESRQLDTWVIIEPCPWVAVVEFECRKALQLSDNSIPEVIKSLLHEWEEDIWNYIKHHGEHQWDTGDDAYQPQWEEVRQLKFYGATPVSSRGTNGTMWNKVSRNWKAKMTKATPVSSSWTREKMWSLTCEQK